MSAKMSKQDRHGVRTATDLEYKYKFGSNFAQAIDTASYARKASSEAMAAAEEVTAAIKRIDNALEELFAQDIAMSGKFTNTVESYLPPEKDERFTIKQHLQGNAIIPADLIPLYDFDNDGVITENDLTLARQFLSGGASFDEWAAAKEAVGTPGVAKSTIVMTIDMADPAKAVCISGTNMWGRRIDGYYGVAQTSVVNVEMEERLELLEEKVVALEGALTALQGG